MQKRKEKAARAANHPHVPPERWVVRGTDRWGEVFHSPHFDKAEAELMMERVNRRGGNVDVYREVWSSPAAAYRTPREVVVR